MRKSKKTRWSSIISKILIILTILITLSFIFWKIICLKDTYNNYSLSKIVTTSIEKKSNLKKYSADAATYNSLKSFHHYTVKMDSDDQGSQNLLYYVGTINRHYYGITFTTLANGRIKLQEIELYKNMQN